MKFPKLKESTKRILFYVNMGILLILGCMYMSQSGFAISEFTIEGITNMNCCGGIQPGVHYRETDTSPPEFVRRCFKSRRDNGSVSYDWNGFPCSSEDSPQCCPGIEDSECIPTTKGGYCRSESGNKVFRRGESVASPYIKRGNDNLLDINNSLDMEDYFYNRDGGSGGGQMSPDMESFLRRRDQNSEYIQSHVIEINRNRLQRETAQRAEAETETKTQQIKSTILFLHLLFLISFALVIKDLIIKDIDGFYTSLGIKYAEFTGKGVAVKTVSP